MRSANVGFLAYDNKFDRKELTFQGYNHEDSQKNNMTMKSINREQS